METKMKMIKGLDVKSTFFVLLMSILGLILSVGCGLANFALSVETTKVNITGRVTDTTTGVGIAGAVVRIKSGKRENDGQTFAEWIEVTSITDVDTTTVDETGEFIFEELEGGGENLILEVSYTPAEGASGYATYRTTIETYIEVKEALSASQIELGDIGLVGNSGSLSGTVYGFTGPLEGVTVYLSNSSDSAGGNFYTSAVSGSDGSFSFSQLPQAGGYALGTLPFDSNSDGLTDFSATTTSITLFPTDINSGDQNVALVLAGAGSEFNLNFSNIENYFDFQTMILSTNAVLDFYFNKPVSDNQYLNVQCTDTTNSDLIPLTVTVDETIRTKVTAVPESLINGHSYGCSMQAVTEFGELYESSGSYPNSTDFTFMVLSEPNASTITDLAFDVESSNNKTITDNPSFTNGTFTSFEALVDGYSIVEGVFSFTLPSDTTFFEVFVRNSDVDDISSSATSASSAFDFTTPITVSDLDSSFITGTQIDETEIPSDRTTIRFVIDNLDVNFVDTITAASNDTISIYVMVRACNENYFGIRSTDYSDSCTNSNVVQLSDGR
jgi:hypothetical protein